MNTTETVVNPEWQKVHPNESERKLLAKTAALLGYKDKMPCIKSMKVPYPASSVSGYEVRFGNWRAKLNIMLREASLFESSRKRKLESFYN